MALLITQQRSTSNFKDSASEAVHTAIVVAVEVGEKTTEFVNNAEDQLEVIKVDTKETITKIKVKAKNFFTKLFEKEQKFGTFFLNL